MDKKYCCKCKEKKDLSCFQKNKSAKDELQHWCKKCCKNYGRKPNNKEYHREYRHNNKEKLREYEREYRRSGKRGGRDGNRDEKNRKEREYRKKRRLEDIDFKISLNLRTRTWKVLKYCNNKKYFKYQEYIGCTPKFLHEYLESKFTEGMAWDNHGSGVGKWNIDHIIACAKFKLQYPGEQKKCFHYTNLQPMWSPENSSKGAK